MKVCPVCQRCFEDEILSCSEADHEPLAKGRVGSCNIISNYRLDLLCEISATGETYLAFNTSLEKTRSVKIIAPELFEDEPKVREQFLGEARDLSAIFHPNVARVFESGTLADGSLYVVTEFSPEPTLRDYLEEKSVTEVGALTIIRQAAEGLSALHALGVLHRNIRPENIILTTDAENRLLARIQNIDFGGIRQKIISSRMGQNLSDLRYFSPEQCAGHSIEAQTDVYSLGIVLYEIIAGNPPFDAPDVDVLINKQINETTPPIKIKNFDIRALLTHTLTDSLQKMTRLRLKTASIFARRIRHIEQIATHSSTPPPVMSYAVTANNPVIISPPKFENPVAVENQIFVEKSSLLEETVIENPLSFESQTVAEKDEMPAAISFDYTTNEIPPIESIIGNPLPENDLEKMTTASFETKAENFEIPITNKPILIEWEQPDDIPLITKALEREEEIFVPEFSSAEPIFIDYQDSVIDTDEANSTISYASEDYQNSRVYAEESLVFSYSNSGFLAKFTENRKVLMGAGIFVLLVMAVGGILLNRQFQLEDEARQTIVQSAPSGKSLPKAAQSEKVLEDNKPLINKPEELPEKDLPNSQNSEITDLPDYQPRETDEKEVAPATTARNKKRTVKATFENRSKPIEDKPVSEKVIDKKGEKLQFEKKIIVVGEPLKSTENAVFSRPRIVKNPKSIRIIP